MNYKVVAERMYALKQEKKITFLYLEKATGIRSDKIARILFGVRPPRLSEFALLCFSLGTSADELLRSDEKWEVIER